ncbi:hypothetical protein TNCV_4728751 [Trichonephila clavipes]|nr:hypothetical protein TNCV_4728751 [Trichonephila clavipes]
MWCSWFVSGLLHQRLWVPPRPWSCRSPLVKVLDHDRHSMSSSPVPLKTRLRWDASSGVVHVTRPWFKITWSVAISLRVAEQCDVNIHSLTRPLPKSVDFYDSESRQPPCQLRCLSGEETGRQNYLQQLVSPIRCRTKKRYQLLENKQGLQSSFANPTTPAHADASRDALPREGTSQWFLQSHLLQTK